MLYFSLFVFRFLSANFLSLVKLIFVTLYLYFSFIMLLACIGIDDYLLGTCIMWTVVPLFRNFVKCEIDILSEIDALVQSIHFYSPLLYRRVPIS